MPNYPCLVCSKNVNNNHRAICCDICDQWVHVRCNMLDAKDYTEMKNDLNKMFYCIYLENYILSALNCQDYVDKFNSYIANSTSQNDNEDENSLPPIDCKY